MGSVVVAYSGGVDSACLAVVAHRVLGGARARGDRRLGVALRRAARAGARGGAALRLRPPRWSVTARDSRTRSTPATTRTAATTASRELFRHLAPLAAAEGFAHVAYGLIVDDLSDFRPGQRAAAEAGVRAPLAEAGLTKEDVRALSRELGLPTAELPASPCLSSRLPYGTPVTLEALRRVERAEAGGARARLPRAARAAPGRGGARRDRARGDGAARATPALREAVEQAVRAAGYARGDDRPRGLPPRPAERGAARGARHRLSGAGRVYDS